MGSAFKLAADPPFRDLQGRYAGASPFLMERARAMIRPQARRLKELAQEEAPEGETGKFRKSIAFRTFVGGNQMGFTMSDAQPLGTWIRGGTRPHIIRAKNASFLRFYWARGPRGAGIYFFRSVNHPGTKKNPYIGRAYRRWIPGARADLKAIGADFTRYLAGKGAAIPR